MSAARSRRANDKHNHLQRTPILVMGCSLLIACCIAFGGTNWTASAQPSEDQLPEQNAIVEPGYYQETIGSYEAISQSDDDERAENLRLAAEAINGYVIEPGATFSFNEVVGDTTAERGYKEAPVLYSSGLGSSDGGGIKSITLDNGSEFKSDAFLFFAPDFVFVDDGSKSAADLRQAEDNASDAPAAAPASTPATQPAPAAQPAAPAANADGLSNEDALLVDFLIGKTLNDDVANADDTFALPKGTEITREIALDAKKHDALLLLTMSVD